ncbi:hypothetical protein K439DRAFT_1640809 [Ramaria rubella]|nr:hypothetical protein K439DRAFT_1640809 [Ramaria rubella]
MFTTNRQVSHPLIRLISIISSHLVRFCSSSSNWHSGRAVAMLAMNWYDNKTLHNTPFANITVDGKAVAAVQNVDNFSFTYV